MIIKNAKILTEQAGLVRGDLRIENGRIAAFGASLADDGEVVQAKEMLLLPGLIDTHNHGYCGTEFASSDEEFDNGTMALAKNGITTVLPTLRSLPKDRMLAAIRNVKEEIRRGPKGAKLAGINMEGPFISPNRTGSMVLSNLSTPSIDDLREYLDACDGLLKTITMAPELPGVLEMMEEALFAGVNASIGHTAATYEQAKAAADIGANLVTHLYNAMSPFKHRDAGVVGEALLDERLNCELICDFVHNSPAAIEMAMRNKGADHLIMVSDTGVMAGLGDGEFIIEGNKRIVKGNLCQTENGTIAGSVCNLFYDFRNLLTAGYPLQDVSHMASRNPARMIGLGDETGTIEIGKAADLILVDAAYNLQGVWVSGEKII